MDRPSRGLRPKRGDQTPRRETGRLDLAFVARPFGPIIAGVVSPRLEPAAPE